MREPTFSNTIDLIERNKAIDVAKKLLDDYGTSAITKEFADDVAEIYINKVPSAQPEPQWIPCSSGKEPDSGQDCWVTLSDDDVIKAVYAPASDNQPNGFIRTDGGFGFYRYGGIVVAWMPYTNPPEPYREDGGE